MEIQGTDILLREATSTDEPFLLEVYASTRNEELAGVDWDDDKKRSFIKMQFLVRERSFPRVDSRIIVWNGQEIGRILVDRGEVEILLRDIAILAEYRNAGIGSRLIQELIREATISSKTIRLHVLETSPALRLYERLGFRRTGYDAAYYEMTWVPPDTNSN